MRNSEILVIIPAKNEQDTVIEVIQSIRALHDWDILLVNDASTDHTATRAEMAGARVLNLATSLGAWGATQTGLRYAEKHDYRIAISMDADGQHRAESLAPLIAPLLNEQAKVSIGAFPERGSLLRRLAWSWFRWLAGVSLSDLTSGLRAYSRPAIQCLASPQATLIDYQDMGVLLLLQQAGLEIIEVPIQMNSRVTGHSRIFSSWWAVGKYMLYTLTLSLARSRPRRIPIKQENSDS